MARKPKKGRRRRVGALSVGRIHVAKRGYAFVETSEGTYFIAQSRLNGAMHGDLVEVARLRSLERRRASERRAKRDLCDVGEAARNAQNNFFERDGARASREMLGSVKRVLERVHERLVGVFEFRNGLPVVRVEDAHIPYDVFIDSQLPSLPASDGDAVVVQISTYPSRKEACCGYIVEVIGHYDPSACGIDMILRKYGIETRFSAGALDEARAIAKTGSVSDETQVVSEAGSALDEAQISAHIANEGAAVLEEGVSLNIKRRDLRDRFTLTIDPPDARDFDDALSAEYLEGRLRVSVHIADVSAYVPCGSSLDLDARRRGTSVYLPDRVVPMLPPELSDGVSSLKPQHDRLAMTVEMYMRADATVEEVEFFPSLIRSDVRLSYDEALELLECESAGDASEIDVVTQYPPALAEALHTLDRLACKLAARRTMRGALDFDTRETRVMLRNDGTPSHVVLRKKNRATALVEECMILANEMVAAHLMAAESPMIYRVHEEPSSDALEDVLPTLREFGYISAQTKTAPCSAQEIQEILLASKDKPEHELITTLLLRAMKRARYYNHFTIHFGLASSAYTHFTSPIRRYPDLMVHRLLKYHLAKVEPPHTLSDSLSLICKSSSEAEATAEAATHDANRLKLCEFLSEHLGEEYRGVISGVNSYGFYVREESMGAEGFVEGAHLAGSFRYERTQHRWVDSLSGASLSEARTYRLGEQVTVKLISVDIPKMNIGFVVV